MDAPQGGVQQPVRVRQRQPPPLAPLLPPGSQFIRLGIGTTFWAAFRVASWAAIQCTILNCPKTGPKHLTHLKQAAILAFFLP